jgi:hypothetical protein
MAFGVLKICPVLLCFVLTHARKFEIVSRNDLENLLTVGFQKPTTPAGRQIKRMVFASQFEAVKVL